MDKNGKVNGKTGAKQGVLVLLIASVLQLFLGIIYVWSVFVQPVSEAFAWPVDSVKLTSSFMLCCFVLGILLGGKLQVKTGPAKVVLAGGLAMALGMLASSFVPVAAPWLIYISYGILGGFGVGMAYNAIISTAPRWFPTRRGMATGVSVCAFGFSTVVFAPLVEVLVGNFGLLNTFRILAAAFAVVTVALFSFIQLPPAGYGQPVAAGGAQLAAKKQYTTGEMLRTKQFYCIALGMMFCTATYFILNPSFKTMAEARGLSAGIGTMLVMITGIANAAGRLAVPLMADKMGPERATVVILLATAASALALSVVSGGPFVAIVAVIAFGYGGSSGVYPLLTADYFGTQNAGANYGMVMVGFMASALLFPLFFSLISSEVVKFVILGVLALVGAALTLLLRASKPGMEAGVRK